jgi:hypothetical protein
MEMVWDKNDHMRENKRKMKKTNRKWENLEIERKSTKTKSTGGAKTISTTNSYHYPPK